MLFCVGNIKADLYNNEFIERVIIFLFLCSVWFVGHKFLGIHHDGIFYAAQALKSVYPENFKNDLFFLGQSQDDFTIFTALYGWVISHLGLENGAFIIHLLGSFFLFCSVYLLCFNLFDRFVAALSVIAVALLSAYYGSQNLLSYGEPFLTARTLAEPFAVLSIFFCIRQNYILAFLAILFSILSHPIIALPAVMFLYFYSVGFSYPRTTLLLIVLGVLLLLSNFSFLSQINSKMDVDWYGITLGRSPFIFVTTWSFAEISKVLVALMSILLAASYSEGALKRSFLAILCTGLLGVGLAYLGDLSRNALLLQIQPWRVLWLVQMFSLLALTYVVIRCISAQSGAHKVIACLAILSFSLTAYGGCYILIFTLLYRWFCRDGRFEPTISIQKIIFILTAFLSFAAAFLSSGNGQEYLTTLGGGQDTSFFDLSFKLKLKEYVESLYVFIMLIFFVISVKRNFFSALSIAIFVNFLASIYSWDMRDAREKNFLGQASAFQTELAGLIPESAVVLFVAGPSSAKVSWFLNMRSHYASSLQLAGGVFSRKVSLEGRRRLARLQHVGIKYECMIWKGCTEVAFRLSVIPHFKKEDFI